MAGNTVVVSVLADTGKFKKAMGDLGGIGKTLGKAMGLVAAAGAAMGLAGLVGDALAASDATDKFKKTLNFAGIKTDVIDALTKSTRAYADQTVYSLADVQSITAQLGSNGVKDYALVTEALGNLNAVAGGNADTFKRVGSVLTQTAGAGKLTTENWNQLSEAIPGASGILQKALQENGAYTGNFRDAMAKGQITAEEFNTALLEIGMTDVAKDAATATDTFEGAWGNLTATIVGGMSDALTAIKPFVTEGMDKLSAAIKLTVDYVKNDLVPNLQGFSEWVAANKDPLGVIAVVVGVLAAALGAKAIALGIASVALGIWTGVTGAASAAQLFFNASLLANPIVLVIVAIAALVAGLVYFFTQTEVGRKAWADFTKFLGSSWKGFTEFITKAWDDTVRFFSGLPGKIAAIFSGALTWLKNAGRNTIDGLHNGVTGAWGAVSSWFGSIPGKITSAIGNAGSILLGAGKAIMDGFLTGLKNTWKGVTDFVGGIATWIRNNKGPLSYDYKLLQPAGKAIMGGFGDALDSGFSDVQRMVSGFAPSLSDAMSGTFSGNLAMETVRAGGTVYTFDGITFNAADAAEASLLEDFAAMVRRKGRAA